MSHHQTRQARFLGQDVGRDADHMHRDQRAMNRGWHQAFDMRRIRRHREDLRREYEQRREMDRILNRLINRSGLLEAISRQIDQAIEMAADSYQPRRSNGEIL